MKIDRERIIGIAVLVVLTVLLYGVFLMPHGRRLKAIRQQYSSAVKLLAAQKTKGGRLEDLREENRQLRKKLYDIRNRFLTKEEINLFLKSFTKLAEDTGNELQAVDPLERKLPAEAGIEKMLVEVTISGDYSSIIGFLDALSKSEKILNITDVKIEREDKETRELTASFELTLFIIEDKRWRL